MELCLRNLVVNYHEFDVDRLIFLNGGYHIDETCLCCTTDRREYLIRSIQYSRPMVIFD